MLKRSQVLLSDWMEEYINLVAEKYDLNISAVIRVHLCLAIICVMKTLYPDYKPNLQDKDLQKLSMETAKPNFKEEEVHQLMSKILFEARKAVEFRTSKKE